MTKHNTLRDSFFDSEHQEPQFIVKRKQKVQQGRRTFLKSASGMAALTTMPTLAFSANTESSLNTLIKKEPWLTLDAALNQLLPESKTGPSAKEINATAYLYQVMTVQPTQQEEKDFILKGVGWLNDYAFSEKSATFSSLTFDVKEGLLRGISKSRAGRNWLNTLLHYIFEAMLAPEAYGGNPNGIGWQWLAHQAGFPLPKVGQRYFELPKRARISLISHVEYNNKSKNSSLKQAQGTQKA